MTATSEYRAASVPPDVNPPDQSNQQSAMQRGWINAFYRTYNGKKLGPYFVRRWKENGRVHKQYIKPQDVERVRAECNAHRLMQKGLREASFLLNRQTANFDFITNMLIRMNEGKVITREMAKYINRIHNEGLFISGRPSLRRKSTRRKLKINGKTLTRKTLFGLNKPTNPFMVPLVDKSLPPLAGEVPEGGWGRKRKASKARAKQFMKIAKRAWRSVHGPTQYRAALNATPHA